MNECIGRWMIDVTPEATENPSAVRELDTHSLSASANILSSPNLFSITHAHISFRSQD